MSRYHTTQTGISSHILEAADYWKDIALLGDGSVFTDGSPLDR